MSQGSRIARKIRAWAWSATLIGCSPSRYIARDLPEKPYDAVIVPGCPSKPDGSLSRCQMGRAGWAAWLYKRGAVRYLIPSGGAVQSPFYEADAMAEAMAALGVPPERIVLERNALHTDENVWNGLKLARALNLTTVAVASNESQATWCCRMLEDWQQPCVALPMDIQELERFLPAQEPLLNALRSKAVTPWVDMSTQEAARRQRTGRTRPPSFFLYPALGYLRWVGNPWVPIGAEEVKVLTWADALAAR